MHLTKYDGGREDNGQRMRPYGMGGDSRIAGVLHSPD